MAEDQHYDIPETMQVWPLYGSGLENLGKDGKPVRWPVPHPAANQLLARSDAVGLCYSDVKIIRLGPQHPRLLGRDLRQNPVVQGHEVTLTVVEVGEDLKGRFRPGDRIAMEADIYFGGRNLAFGYYFHGGLEQYALIGPEILDGDEGCYALPVPSRPGICRGGADRALGLCGGRVQAAAPSAGKAGRNAVDRRPSRRWHPYHLGDAFAGGSPARVVLTDVPTLLQQHVEAAGEGRVTVSLVSGRGASDVEAYRTLAARAGCPDGFDDMIVLGAAVCRADRGRVRSGRPGSHGHPGGHAAHGPACRHRHRPHPLRCIVLHGHAGSRHLGGVWARAKPL